MSRVNSPKSDDKDATSTGVSKDPSEASRILDSRMMDVDLNGNSPNSKKKSDSSLSAEKVFSSPTYVFSCVVVVTFDSTLKINTGIFLEKPVGSATRGGSCRHRRETHSRIRFCSLGVSLFIFCDFWDNVVSESMSLL